MKSADTYRQVIGAIVSLRVRGQDFPTEITVQYTVDGIDYSITETIKLKSEKIKLGFIPIGQRRVPRMPETHVGGRALVYYDPANPEKAFLAENQGLSNV